MISEELKQVLSLSGGKVIVSEGSVEDSYVVMKLNDYLKEIAVDGDSQEAEDPELPRDAREKIPDDAAYPSGSLTSEELLDRMNADIAQLRQRTAERELEEALSEESGELDYDYV